jgi:hypothetical protein
VLAEAASLEGRPVEDEQSSNRPRRAASRWEWERALRAATSVPWHVKSFLLLIGTYMDGSGNGAQPSAAALGAQCERSRQRVFELLKEAEGLGWIRTEGANGKKKTRLPFIPPPSDRSYRSEEDEEDGTSQTGLTGGSDVSDGTRQTGQTRQEQEHLGTTGGAPPPDPRRADAPRAARRIEQEPEPDRTKTTTTEVERESPVPSGDDASADGERFRFTGTGALRAIGTPEALAELGRRKTAGMSWRRQRAATAHLDPSKRAAVREDLEAQRRRAAFRVVEPLGDTSGTAS